jgi:hypothetical protein
MTKSYTVQLGAGLSLIEETPILLDLWQEGMSGADLYRAALESGQFPSMSARRLHDFISVGFALRYLNSERAPAPFLKQLKSILPKREFDQLLYLYTCRVHAILADFVREIYWPAYAAGKDELTNDEARVFTAAAAREGKTTTAWSDTMIRRAGSNVTGCLAEFGLLEAGAKSVRKILPYRLEPNIAAYLAYDLHFAGCGDNRIINHEDWALFGLQPDDVLEELKRLSLRGFFIVQSAGGVIRIGWTYKCMQELIDVFAKG